jgi:two-component system, response regulator RegA
VSASIPTADAAAADAVDRLLLVEDDQALRKSLARALGARRFVVDAAGSLSEARDRLAAGADAESGEIRFAVLDLRLPDGSSLDLVPELRARHADARIVVLTGWGSIATAIRSLRLGVVDFLSKPFDVEAVVAALRGAPRTAPDATSLAPSLDRVEWEHLQRVLEEAEGNVSLAARRLGLHRRSLQRKLGKRPPAD